MFFYNINILLRKESIFMAFKIGNVESTGKILQWNGNSVAINKINSVDLTYSERKFPFLSVVLIVLGIFLITTSFLITLLMIAGGAYWIYWWSNHKVYNYRVNLRTSSTEPFVIYYDENGDTGNKVKNAIIEEISNL